MKVEELTGVLQEYQGVVGDTQRLIGLLHDFYLGEKRDIWLLNAKKWKRIFSSLIIRGRFCSKGSYAQQYAKRHRGLRFK